MSGPAPAPMRNGFESFAGVANGRYSVVEQHLDFRRLAIDVDAHALRHAASPCRSRHVMPALRAESLFGLDADRVVAKLLVRWTCTLPSFRWRP